MNEKLTGLVISANAEQCSGPVRALLRLIREEGMTYSRMLFPYVDNLILSKEQPQLLGTHLLFETDDAAFIEKCAERTLGDLPFRVLCVECSVSGIDAFFSEKCVRERNSILVGDLTALLSGEIQPWLVRECARRMSSFAEHIFRQNKVDIVGFGAGGLRIRSMKPREASSLADIYENKTGALMPVAKR